MANKEQMSILKRGVEAWNGWRSKNLYLYTDLNEADLNGADLGDIDLRIAHLRRASLFRANLSRANLSGADLSDANLWEANLSEANLTKANLNGASLRSAFVKGANLSQANLLAANLRNTNLSQVNLSDATLTVAHLGGADVSGANLSKSSLAKAQLSGANLRRVDLSGTRLNQARLTKASLVEARFIGTELAGTNLSESVVGNSVFANCDLSEVTGLEQVVHLGPSHVSLDTLVLSRGKLPERFLRGCGLSDVDIEYAKLNNPDLDAEKIEQILHRIGELRRVQTIQVAPLFICYGEGDGRFIDKLGKCLGDRGIRYWLDLHAPKIGRTEQQIDRGRPQPPKVILILSKHTLESDWVEQEVRAVGDLEKELGRDVLFPVKLDERWKDSRWSGAMMEQILQYDTFDFSAWKDERSFDHLVQHLIDWLELFQKR